MQKHKVPLQQQQQVAAAAQGQQAAVTQQTAQVQPAQATPQIATVATPRPLLTTNAMRLVRCKNCVIFQISS